MGPLVRLQALLDSGEAIVAGCLSGTSADGIDVALVRFPPRDLSGRVDVRTPGEAGPDVGRPVPGEPEVRGPDVGRPVPGESEVGGPDVGRPVLLAFETLAFERSLGQRLREVLDGRPLDPRGVALLDRDLGRAFGRAARRVADDAGLPLHLVASHGQTVWHHDETEPSGPATLQLGNPDFLAEEAGASVASGFRDGDLAAGGVGAPLSALADGLLFSGAPRPTAVLNLGGLANLTLLGGEEEVEAFDTGPAGALLDGLARLLLDRPFDDRGEVAATGRVDPGLLGELLAHPFFSLPPPKSTGRDTFGAAWVAQVHARARRLRVGPKDLLATATELVAESAARGLALARRVTGPFPELVLAGGGRRHRPLVEALARRTGLAARPASVHGVDADAREALVFAVLGARCLRGLPSTRTSVTGARPGRILGRLTLRAGEPLDRDGGHAGGHQDRAGGDARGDERDLGREGDLPGGPGAAPPKAPVPRESDDFSA